MLYVTEFRNQSEETVQAGHIHIGEWTTLENTLLKKRKWFAKGLIVIHSVLENQTFLRVDNIFKVSTIAFLVNYIYFYSRQIANVHRTLS